jgi:hypothetical protein
LVAVCTLTSVNVNTASPQFDTLTVADVLLPTARSPKDSVSALVQMRAEANAPGGNASVVPTMTSAAATKRCMRRCANEVAVRARG